MSEQTCATHGHLYGTMSGRCMFCHATREAVQPPATPQEPEQPVKGYTLQGLSNYFGWGLRDDRAIWRFIHERESLLRLCQSLLGTEKSKAQTAELAIRERIEQLSTPSPEGQTWCFSEAELRLLVEGVGRLPSFTPERRALQDSLTERLSRALLPSPPTPEGTQP